MPDPEPPAADVEGEAVVELEDLATLDLEASVDEVMTVVHWIEGHTGATPHGPERAVTMREDVPLPKPGIAAAPALP
ncbi:hypothetical protein [Brevundimonas subvibrioides]|uniref:Uncharacterized protein n=1 Tax=Brevundimonas subvibrioides (strain ATCC 15264 / DSM 4735 / LMG 14903 / NBRC 16000 / CB 81) TaxID=633149 RepID=D9QLE7_BRESC|nr:hypothetical protein [Brevundimonas subvibrioides]ADL01841.1 protein of unknown function UPF0079 [Brevundimonas subvibrioides ATCC 15264]